MEKPESQIRQVELGDVTFENPFTNELPGDESLLILAVKFIMHTIQEFFLLHGSSETLAVSEEVRLLLGITSDVADSTEFTEIFSGNAVTQIWIHMQCAMGASIWELGRTTR